MASSVPSSLKNKVSSYFGAHGRFCASHPWEVIVSIVTLTVCALSMSVLSGGKVGIVCGFSKPCQPKPADEEVADTVMLSIVNSLAVIYIYNQFSQLRKAGSKYLLGIAGLFAIFSSFVFGSTVVNIIDNQVSGLNEALPFFLLLIDLSKASALAKMAFKSRSKEEVREKIGEGIAYLGPTMTLDTLVEILLFSIGTISGVPRFETMCCFGCMSIIASYLVFMTFFPASLALVLEVCPHDPSNSGWHLDNLARDMQEEEVTKKPNPVAQRVKIIMALGLSVVHVHSWFSGFTGLTFGFGSSLEENGSDVAKGREEIEMVPLHNYLWWKVFNLSIDQMIAIALASGLFIKYIFFDKSDMFSTSVPPTPTLRPTKSTTVPSPADSIQPTPGCPFAFPEVTKASLVPRQRTSSLSVSSSILTAAATTRVGKNTLQDFGTLIDNGIVIDSGTLANSSNTPALPPATVGGLEGIPLMESSGGMTKNKSSGSLVHLMGCTKGNVSRVDLLLNPATATVSIGVQTDLTTPTADGPVFTIGYSDRKTSVASSIYSNSGSDSEQRASSTPPSPAEPRNLDTCLTILKSDGGAGLLTDTEVVRLVDAKQIPAYKLETVLDNPERGVSIRRQLLSRHLSSSTATSQEALTELPFTDYPHYSIVNGACCENVIGYIPVPVGYAGPLTLDGTPYMVPMATTEGALVASTNRGCRALAAAGGVHSSVLGDGMTRGPVVRLPSATQASEVKVWLDHMDNFQLIEEAFNQTSRFARLKSLHTAIAGRLLYIRFKATTGDAMGMNMISKGVDKALDVLKEKFPLLEVISISGNFCTDKKSAAINWLEGRGKSVVCEATIPAQTVAMVLKTSVAALVELNISKNLVGSAMAGSIGGYNAHASNIVTAIFIATGQDPAQNITSSNCMTLMERSGPTGEDLHISCTMPSIEIGTVGGGTILPPQGACLNMLGLRGANKENPGANATQLARVVCATVLAGELSLLSALAAGHLVKSHLKHNRSQLNLASIAEGKEVKEHRRTNSASLPTSPSPIVPVPPRRASIAHGTTTHHS